MVTEAGPEEEEEEEVFNLRPYFETFFICPSFTPYETTFELVRQKDRVGETAESEVNVGMCGVGDITSFMYSGKKFIIINKKIFSDVLVPPSAK